jgi:hypothetical protein
VRKGLVSRVLRWVLQLLGLGFLTGALVGTRLVCGDKAEAVRADVANTLRSLANRLEQAGRSEVPEEEEA